jgi:hypothetical protein
MVLKGIGIMSIVSYIAILALFAGVLSSTAIDILKIVANPLSIAPWREFVLNIASTITNSQNTISKSVDAFAGAADEEKAFLFWRILGCSVITGLFVWGVHKGLKYLVPGTRQDLGAKILVWAGAIIGVWIIGILASYFSGQGMPSFFGFYNGWIEIIVQRGVFIQYLIKAIAKG